jgi:hypothetical protein
MTGRLSARNASKPKGINCSAKGTLNVAPQHTYWFFYVMIFNGVIFSYKWFSYKKYLPGFYRVTCQHERPSNTLNRTRPSTHGIIIMLRASISFVWLNYRSYATETQNSSYSRVVESINWNQLNSKLVLISNYFVKCNKHQILEKLFLKIREVNCLLLRFVS